MYVVRESWQSDRQLLNFAKINISANLETFERGFFVVLCVAVVHSPLIKINSISYKRRVRLGFINNFLVERHALDPKQINNVKLCIYIKLHYGYQLHLQIV